MCFGGMPKDNSRQIEQERQQRVSQGMQSIDSTFSQFNPAYYQGFEDTAYGSIAPDIDKQYKDAIRNTTYSLARGGNRRSSAGAGAYGDLKETYDKAKLEGRDRARMQAGERRRDVENTRGNLVSQLNATTDPAAAAQSAVSQAALLTTPPAYSPIGQIFANITGQIADAQQARRDGRGNWLGGPITTSSRGSRSSSDYIS